MYKIIKYMEAVTTNNPNIKGTIREDLEGGLKPQMSKSKKLNYFENYVRKFNKANGGKINKNKK